MLNKTVITNFGGNKSTLTVHFYLSTPPSEKLGICPEIPHAAKNIQTVNIELDF